ncbi:MAG: AAA family ATPase [Candidatus Neomarinimicrobiota bacterium]|jgi:MoxR-like ATPase|tara:strand:+ start:389 stop:1384 length:996 start_codon:yes stop_codon:yes gene_type:complete
MSNNINDTELLEQLVDAKNNFFLEIGKIVIGQKGILDQMLIALLTKGHTLLVGVPGLAKTLLIKSMAEICDLNFKRIQFTPDLMPSDITGTELIDIDPETEQRNFRFYKGPIFGNIILADEINRTPPKTQAALLEAMQEHRVTAGGHSYKLDEPFFVLATQNPIEQEGTYPLPEAQLDRFMFHLNINYPSIEEEVSIVNRTTISNKYDVKKVFSKNSITSFQDLTLRVPIAENVVTYAVKLASSTRPNEETSDSYVKQWVEWGAGPRASQYLALGAKAKALLDGRPTPSIEDIQSIAPDILRHRVLPNFNAEAEGIKVDDIVNHLIKNTEA